MGKDVEPVLITGSEGFLGKHLQAYLHEHEVPFETLDREGLPLWRHDIRFRIPNTVSRFSRVIHLAGLLGTHELFYDITNAIDVNIKGTVNVLELCRRTGAAFTGVTMAHVWENPYETTKLAAERLARAWGREYGFDVNYYTIYNAFGEYQAVGDRHPQKIIPTFARRAWNNQAIPVWGDGLQVVDLVYAGHVAQLLADNPNDGTEGGYGIPLTVDEVATMVWQAVNPRPVRIDYLPMRMGEHTPTRDPVATKPMMSVSFEDDLCRTVEWYKERLRYP